MTLNEHEHHKTEGVYTVRTDVHVTSKFMEITVLQTRTFCIGTFISKYEITVKWRHRNILELNRMIMNGF